MPVIGRPTSYTEDLAKEIIKQRMDKPLSRICKAESMPCRATVYNWFNDYPGFLDNYMRACEIDADNEFDELISLADECDDPTKAQIFKLRIDTRKWVLSKRLPLKYGDKIHKTIAGDQDNPIQHSHTVTPEDALKERGIPVPGVELEDVE